MRGGGTRIQYAMTADGVSIAFWTLGEGMPLVDMVYAQAAAAEDPSACVDWEAQKIFSLDRRGEGECAS